MHDFALRKGVIWGIKQEKLNYYKNINKYVSTL